MGMDFNTIVAYGIDFGGPQQGWKIREADEVGGWYPAWHEHGGLITSAERLLLADAGSFEDDDHESPKKVRGLEFVSYRAQGGKEAWLLVAWHKVIYLGEIYDLSWLWLNHERIRDKWDAKLIEAMEVLGANSVDGPGWLVTSHVD